MEQLRNWDGDEWQKHIQLLLNRHYGPEEYVEVPDRHKGDFGLEGFARNGSVYQCYAPEEPLSTDELYKKQRIKVTNDIRKFIENKDALKNIFGPTKIKRWILVVPRHDSAQIIIHAEKKAKEVRNANLSYVDNEFFIHIITDKKFAVELEAIRQIQLLEINYLPKVEQDEIDDWADNSKNTDFIKNLTNKLSKLPNLQSDPTKIKTFADKMIRHYYEGQNSLSFFLHNYPEVYQEIIRCKSGRERFLETECLISTGENTQLFSNIINKYKDELLQEVKGITKQTAEVLIYESISDWLMRCPLDFYGGDISA